MSRHGAIAAFVAERCEQGAGYAVSIREAYAAWEEWCGALARRPQSIGYFGRGMHAVVPSLSVVNARLEDGSRRRYYEGIRLR